MKKNRAKSKNIEDRRAYFGSDSISNMSQKEKVGKFLTESFEMARSGYVTKSKFKKTEKNAPKGPKKRSYPNQNLVRYYMNAGKKKKK